MSIRFRALKHRNFQLFFAGQLVSLIGTWMQSTAQLWLVYKMTNSPALLGIFGFASQIPILFLASLGGYVGDRYNRHRGVIWTQIAALILAFALAALTLLGVVRVWEIVLIAFLAGIVNAFDVPIRQAFLVQMVGKEDLPNAIALNSSIFNGARVVGPAIAGFAIAWIGEGWCFFLNGVSFLAVIIALLMMRIEKIEIRAGKGSPLRNFVQGFHFAMSDRPIRSALLLMSLMSMFGLQYPVFLPIFARDILHGGPGRLGAADELRRSWSGDWRTALRRANGLQNPGGMDRRDLHGLRCGTHPVFTVARLLAFGGDAADCRFFGHLATRSHQYHSAGPRAR